MNPVKELLTALEETWATELYDSIRIITNHNEIICRMEDISYCTRYFFKVSNDDLLINSIININNLEMVEFK